ncbi:MAG TPA: alpha/beta hydrolase [Alphaproteobacteria bacterium]|nr:alpha/beta hydrolase [Alphaproteobacteria bacterium]
MARATPTKIGAGARVASDERVVLADGCGIATTLYGGANVGRARVVLVHSLAMDHIFWRPVAERLASQAAVLTYDARGHGESDKPTGPYSTAQFAQDLLGLLDHFKWPSAVVAGASMGGCIALDFAATHPARALGLGLIDTTAWYGPDARQQWAERARRAQDAGLGTLVGFQIERWFGEEFRKAHPGAVQRAVDTFLRNDVDAYAASCAMLGACDLRAALPKVKAPTAVLVGAEDYATPVAMAEALAHGIAGARLVVLPGARHFTPIEKPDAIADELRRLAGLPVPR